MEIIEVLVTGDITVYSDTQYNNVFLENVIVNENVTARIYGQINGDITLNTKSKLVLHGSYHGQVNNNGGEIEVY